MMPKPVLLTVDDDPEVLRAVERDLRRKYARDYRVIRADSGVAALDVVQQLQRRNDPIALLLVDQRMPRMSGVEFLEQALTYVPTVKRVLLTAYADTDAAIQAINAVKIDYYLVKPWDPPEEKLYPVLDDLLEEWQANYRPPFDGMRVIDHRWSAAGHLIRDFLARNLVPYQWLDIETSAEAQRQRALAGSDHALPLVVFADGSVLSQPSNVAIAEKIGLQTRAEQRFYDLIIVGAGPAGLAAAVYGASEGLRTALIEREAPGGQAGTSSRIENYLGFPQGLSGAELSRRAVAQARKFGVEVLAPQEVRGVRVEGTYRVVTLSDGSELSCHALVIATGVAYRKLDVPGVEQLTGAGVYYGAASTEAMSYKDDDVYIVGGANSAGQAAMYFSRYARSVTMLVRGDGLSASMSHYLINQIAETPHITVRTHTHVAGVRGTDRLEEICIVDDQGVMQPVPATALFIFIGAAPRTEWLDGVVERDKYGFILAGSDLIRDGKPPKNWKLDRPPFLLETSVPGIFVAGDVRAGSVKRVASGVGEGSIAVQFVHRYLSSV